MKAALETRFVRIVLACTWVVLLGAFGPSYAGGAEDAISAAAPLIPGDHPDPTVLRVGATYWLTSTSGNWMPAFTLYRSADLIHWSAAGAVFEDPPSWARGDFWAPELVSGPEGVMLYYAARKKDGPLCVAAATAVVPQGPYRDRGPLVCEDHGSIDPAMVRDEHGRPYLIWKEDGNSVHQPTPIWAQPLTNDLVHLTGKRTKLIENDAASWEGGIVEGPYIMSHSGKFFLFYAANACCGVGCHYAEGVARADRLLGPWVKNPANPIIPPNGLWRCPGHGTVVTSTHGENYLVYHAYPAVGMTYVGREAILDRIAWTGDDWPLVNHNRGPGGVVGRAPVRETDDFREARLDPEWKWPIGRQPDFVTGKGLLSLIAAEGSQPRFVARSIAFLNYDARVAVSSTSGAAGGFGLIGESERSVAVFRSGNHVVVKRMVGEVQEVLAQAETPAEGLLWLRIVSNSERRAAFSYSLDAKHWTELSLNVSFDELPAWDRGLRIGLFAEGAKRRQASFSHFTISFLPNEQ